MLKNTSCDFTFYFFQNANENVEENILLFSNEPFKSKTDIEVHGVCKSTLIIKKVFCNLV